MSVSAPGSAGAERYRVVLLNDDATPMEFVVTTLQSIFDLGRDKAIKIMLSTHHTGRGVCGQFDRGTAETRVGEVLALAREHKYPLQCTMEKE